MQRKDNPLALKSEEQREEAWDDLYATEEGIVIEFEPVSNAGKIRSLADNNIYKIDNRELVRIKIELRIEDKVLFAPFEDSDGDDYARVIKIVELHV